MTRRGTGSRDTIAVAATASGGETIAPSATATAHGMSGKRCRATTATTAVVTITSPTASVPILSMFRLNSRSDVNIAADQRIGGRKTKKTRFGSSCGIVTPGMRRNGEAGEHLENRRRHGQAPRERRERDDEHGDDDREDDRLKVHCEWFGEGAPSGTGSISGATGLSQRWRVCRTACQVRPASPSMTLHHAARALRLAIRGSARGMHR